MNEALTNRAIQGMVNPLNNKSEASMQTMREQLDGLFDELSGHLDTFDDTVLRSTDAAFALVEERLDSANRMLNNMCNGHVDCDAAAWRLFRQRWHTRVNDWYEARVYAGETARHVDNLYIEALCIGDDLARRMEESAP